MKRHSISLVAGAFALAGLVGGAGVAAAAPTQILTTNAQSTASGSVYYRTTPTDGPIAQQFTLTGATTLSSVSLYIGDTGSSGTTSSQLTVGLYSDSGGQVGTLLDTAINPSSNPSTVAFTPASPFTFADNPTVSAGTYWIELSTSNTSAPPNVLRWLGQNNSSFDNSSSYGNITHNNLYLGAYHTNASSFTMDMYGATAVPEPATTALAIVGVGLGMRRRRAR